ncbi:MAG: TonB-dependent receptor [Gemmatimonadetes bacterium]|nr:TonB-dependent receptor [Gemmatimonadota bacterium]
MVEGRSLSSRAVILLALVPLLAPAAPARAQAPATGTILGQVVVSGTRQPLGSVQVFIPGSGLGTLTGDNGRFIMLNVPAGTYDVRAERIGYQTAERQATVRAGEPVQLTFELQTDVLGFDEIVVTGTAGAARRREIGNSIAQLSVAQLEKPPLSIENLLQGQVAGATILSTGGSIAAGSQIRLRGNNSVAMSNQPLVYVDGVRIRSDPYPNNNPTTGSTNRGSNYHSSPLNDINPNDIERLEVIRGAAATTLYGTEAAAGVIQIFTKRGRQATKPVWTLQIDEGFDHLHAFGPREPGPNGEDASRMFMDPWLRNANRLQSNLSLAGGTQDIQYFLSGSYRDIQGVLPLDDEETFSVRGNLTATPLPGLQLQWSTSYSSSRIDQTPTGNNLGLTLNVYRRDRNYVASAKKEDIDQFIHGWELTQWINHFVTGLTATHSFGFLTQRLTLGYDLADFNGRNYRAFGQISWVGGAAIDKRWESASMTVDYVATAAFNLTDNLRNSFSIGGQSIATEELFTAGEAINWPGPGNHVISNGAVTLGMEGRQRVVNAGFFVQNVFDLNNRYFLTAGIRVDGNSAFGENLGLQRYPKLSLSYVISDEEFWPESLGRVKLRAAWGQAGRAPGAFDAVKTWEALSWGGSALRPNQSGNPDLAPERTTEREFGFDASFLDDRLSLDLSYYHQKVTDALFPVTPPPSMGFQNPQLGNVGELENKGIELTAKIDALRRSNFGWSIGGSVSTNHSRVLSLAGAPPLSLGRFGWIMEGQPVPVIRSRCVLNPDELAAPVLAKGPDCIHGPNLPTTIINASTSFSLPWGISLSARAEYQGGGYMNEEASNQAIRRNVNWPTCWSVYKKQGAKFYDAKNESMLTAMERARCNPRLSSGDYNIYPIDFMKIRELTLRAPLPQDWIPGASSAALTLSAQNFWRWLNSDFRAFEPEMSGQEGSQAKVRYLSEHIPAPATYLMSIRVTF